MTLTDGYIIREIAGNLVAVPISQQSDATIANYPATVFDVIAKEPVVEDYMQESYVAPTSAAMVI